MKAAFKRLKLKKGERGDTIVEVLISMVILSLVLGAAYATSNRSLRNATESGRRTQGLVYAQQQVELIKAIAAKDTAGLDPYKLDRFCIDPNTTNPVPLSAAGNCDATFTGSPTPEYRLYNHYDTATETFSTTIEWDTASGQTDKTTVSYKPQNSFTSACPSPCSVPVDTNPTPPNTPIVHITATPTIVLAGGRTTLTWTSTNSPSHCDAVEPPNQSAPPWKGSQPTNGNSGLLKIDDTTTFTLNCFRPGLVTPGTDSVTVRVAKILTFTPRSGGSASDKLAYNTSAIFDWSAQNVNTCTINGAPQGNGSGSNVYTSGALTSDTDFTLACLSDAGPVQITKRVYVTRPAVTFSTPLTSTSPGAGGVIFTSSGTTRTLRWAADNAWYCLANWGGVYGPSGSSTITVYPGTTYQITCSGPGPSASSSFAFTYHPSYFHAYKHAYFDSNWPGYDWYVGEGYYGLPGDMSSFNVYGLAAVRDNYGHCYSAYGWWGWNLFGWVEDWGLVNDNFGSVYVGHDCNGY